MGPMLHRTIFRHTVLAASLALAFSSLHASAQQDDSHRGRKYKAPPPSSRIEVTVLRDINGKPIEHAAVIFHPMQGDKDTGALELKTNEEGKAIIDVIPIGDTVRMQIIAPGFQTYGQDYKIDKESLSFEVRMKRPGGQYSIYKPREETPDSGNSSGDKSAPPAKDAAPPASQPKP